jgi:ligand-binding SRPBCC domain-containing protein
MPIIQITTHIKANRKLVFDLSRSLDLHKISTQKSNETAIAGKTSGLIELHESVTWRAKHFGVYQTLSSRITEFNSPEFFTDEMVSGAFKSFKHQHIFEKNGEETLMKDIFDFTSPLGFLGRLADKLVLKKYMTNLLEERNKVIKDYAETDKWKSIIEINQR